MVACERLCIEELFCRVNRPRLDAVGVDGALRIQAIRKCQNASDVAQAAATAAIAVIGQNALYAAAGKDG